MANVATNLFRELFSRFPTKANEVAAETRNKLETARYHQRCAVLKLARTIGEVISEKDHLPSDT